MFSEKGNNIFTATLEQLGVKHTKPYSNAFFNTHPHKYNLFGISKMLKEFGVKNGGIQIHDKTNDLCCLSLPFIAHIGKDFVVVHKTDDKNVHYRWNENNIVVSKDKFCESWSGIVLLLEKSSTSIEPNYKEHKKNDIIKSLQRSCLFLLIISVFALVYIQFSFYKEIIISILIIVNALGIYTGVLLFFKQFKINNTHANKVCSVFKQKDCKNILNSKASKIFNLISWSEVGITYFFGNIIIIFFLNSLYPLSVLLNILALPYGVWSIWYQKSIAKQWCPLCIIVQILIWTIFIINIIFGVIVFENINLINLFILGCVYIIPLFSLNLIASKLPFDSNLTIQEYNSLKANEKVFTSLLKEQQYYEIINSSSNIVFGNPEASIIITILSNPHCYPCAKMHTQVDELLKAGLNNLRIQYLFTNFDYNKKLEYSSRFLIFAYQYLNIELSKNIFNDWFNGKESFFYSNSNKSDDEFIKLFSIWFLEKQQYEQRIIPLDLMDKKCIEEYEKHVLYGNSIKRQGTPTVLVNGYLLPDSYELKDLKYFSALNL